MPELTYLSLGWGVQSWTIAAMAALGELPPVDLAIHSDTGHEAAGTYAHAEKWTSWLEERGVLVVTVRPENNSVIREDWGKKSGTPSIQIPAFTFSHSSGDAGQIDRQCTRQWKITPIRKHLRIKLGRKKPKAESVECWQGISLDEWSRMRDSDVKYIRNVYPLVDRRMTRLDCIQWLQKHNLDVPPKSACVFCPFHKMSEWHSLKQSRLHSEGISFRRVRSPDAPKMTIVVVCSPEGVWPAELEVIHRTCGRRGPQTGFLMPPKGDRRRAGPGGNGTGSVAPW